MKIFLRGKKLIVIVIALFVVITGGFLVVRDSHTEYNADDNIFLSSGNGDDFQKAAFAAIAGKDSDGDGLKDWEEELWGTDFHNPDTDGDGTNDGDEVDAGRNPLKAGPDDELDTGTILKKFNNGNAEAGEQTVTGQFAKEFFADYIALRQQGQELDEDSKNFLINNTINSLSNKLTSTRQYSISDILTSEDISSAAIKQYGNEMGAIIIEHSTDKDNDNEGEVVILRRALENNDAEELKKLDPIILVYRNILRDMLNTIVPQNASSAHLSLVNGVVAIADTIEGMRATFYDPVVALSSAAVYHENVQKLFDGFQDLDKYFKEQNIVFDENDNGHIFAHIIQL